MALNFEKDIKFAVERAKSLNRGCMMKLDLRKVEEFLNHLANFVNSTPGEGEDGRKAHRFNKVVDNMHERIAHLSVLDEPKCPHCGNFLLETGWGTFHDRNSTYLSFHCLNCGCSCRVFSESGKVEKILNPDFEGLRE